MDKKENNQFLYEWQDANLVLPPLNQECVLQFNTHTFIGILNDYGAIWCNMPDNIGARHYYCSIKDGLLTRWKLI